MKKIRDNKIFNIVFKTIRFIFFFLVFIYVAFLLVQRFVKVDIAGYKMYTILTGSMEPTFEKGDVILIRKEDYASIKEGDIITYQKSDGMVITHRVVNLGVKDGENFIITKGDVNPVNDEPIRTDQVLGVFKRRMALYSFITKAMNNKYIFFFGVFVVFTVLIFFDVVDYIKDFKNRKIEDDK